MIDGHIGTNKMKSSLQNRIEEFEKRQPAIEAEEVSRRRREYDLAEASTKISGGTDRTPDMEKIITLYVSGKVSDKEYMDLCKQTIGLKPSQTPGSKPAPRAG